jgi:hypothetical protein
VVDQVEDIFRTAAVYGSTSSVPVPVPAPVRDAPVAGSSRSPA